MSNIFVLFFGKVEDGNREDCSIFYTPFEVFDDKNLMIERRKEIRRQQKAIKTLFLYTYVAAAPLNEKLLNDEDAGNIDADSEPILDPAMGHDEVFDAHYLK